jgi:hypothetical protein
MQHDDAEVAWYRCWERRSWTSSGGFRGMFGVGMKLLLS